MKKYTNLLMIAAISLLFFAAANAQTPNLITGNSAGKVKIGMTVAQVRKAVAPMRLSRTSDGEGVALIALKNGKNMVMTLYAGEENREAKINEKAKVEQIWVWSKSYKTANGVRAGMLVSQAEKILGPLKEIVRSEIESREFAEFTDQPAGIDLRLNSGDGDFPVGSNRTTKYAPAARIFSINVLGSRVKKDDGITFSSVVTDITKNCKSFGGDDGGHVSTLCPGPAGFQIHYFDSASSYQMNVADASRDWEVPLTGFALDMIKNLKSVEWRLADGIPFAVIFRHPTNGDVIAKGLKSFEKLSVKAEGKPALSIARAMIDEQYKDAIIPATPIYFSGKNTQVTVKGQLPNYDDKLKYRVKGKAGDRLKVSISAVKWKGEEAPVMVGIVTMPDGESDGAPGGTIYDDVLTQDGDYEIVVYQNGAKSQTPNVEIEITFTIVMKADKTAQSSDEIVSGHLPSGVKLLHQVVKGDIGGSANSIVALYAKEGPAMSYSGMVLMPDGTGYK
ncbi:MAG: hypothetical protein ACRD6X_05375, partial [Pyrinomonadaceae bacterium]